MAFGHRQERYILCQFLASVHVPSVAVPSLLMNPLGVIAAHAGTISICCTLTIAGTMTATAPATRPMTRIPFSTATPPWTNLLFNVKKFCYAVA